MYPPTCLLYSQLLYPIADNLAWYKDSEVLLGCNTNLLDISFFEELHFISYSVVVLGERTEVQPEYKLSQIQGFRRCWWVHCEERETWVCGVLQ